MNHIYVETEEELILIKKTSEPMRNEISLLKSTLKEKEGCYLYLYYNDFVPDYQIQLITDYEQELIELQEEIKSNSTQKKRIITLIGTI